MSRLFKSTIIICILLLATNQSASAADPKQTGRQFKLNRDCFGGPASLLGALSSRDVEKRAILDHLPDPQRDPVLLLKSEGTGTCIITDIGKGMEWQVLTEVFEASRISKTGDVEFFHIGLADGVLYNNQTGKVFAPSSEVWIARSAFGEHYNLAAQMRNASVIHFVDGVSTSTQLAQAATARVQLQKKLSTMTVGNSVLVNCLPKSKLELQILAYSTGRIQDWIATAKQIDSLGFRRITPRPDLRYLKELEAAASEGKNILVWAHSVDGVNLAIPIVSPGGVPSVMWINANQFVLTLRAAVSKSSDPGLLVFNSCRSVETAESIVAQIAGEGLLPLVAPRDRYASANVEFLQGVADGKPMLKKMVGILTVLKLMPLPLDELFGYDEDEEGNDGHSP